MKPQLNYMEIQIKRNWKIILPFLVEREKDFLERRLGILNGHTRTLADIGKEFGVTRQWCQRVIENVYKRVKLRLNDTLTNF